MKQERDVLNYNKDRKENVIDDSAQAFMKTKRRLKQAKPYKKVEIEKVNRTTVTTKDGKRSRKTI